MPSYAEDRPPRLWRWLIYAAGWVAPAALRAEWRARWDSRLQNLYILIERGELPPQAPSLCRDAVVSAFRLRFVPASWRAWVRGPSFVLLGAALILALTAAFTHGFATTRSLADTALSWSLYPVPRLPNMQPPRYDPLGDRVIAHLVPLMLAMATGIVLLLIGRLSGLSLGRYGWRYWVFLAAKTAAVMAIVPLLWIEGGEALRARIPSQVLGVLIGGVGLALVFIAVFGGAIVWVFSDQRLRCPVCLRRLAMPVALGSWASTFDPPATEFLCDAGHGSLCVSEIRAGEPDRWVNLDDSWRTTAKPRKR